MAGVVHQYVHGPDRIGQGFTGARFGKVGRVQRHLDVKRRPDPRAQGIELVGAARGQMQVHTLGRKGFGQMLANAHRGSGNERGLSRQFQIDRVSFRELRSAQIQHGSAFDLSGHKIGNRRVDRGKGAQVDNPFDLSRGGKRQKLARFLPIRGGTADHLQPRSDDLMGIEGHLRGRHCCQHELCTRVASRQHQGPGRAHRREIHAAIRPTKCLDRTPGIGIGGYDLIRAQAPRRRQLVGTEIDGNHPGARQFGDLDAILSKATKAKYRNRLASLDARLEERGIGSSARTHQGRCLGRVDPRGDLVGPILPKAVIFRKAAADAVGSVEIQDSLGA